MTSGKFPSLSVPVFPEVCGDYRIYLVGRVNESFIQSTWNSISYVVRIVTCQLIIWEDACGNKSFEPGVRKCGTINQRCVTLAESLIVSGIILFLHL